MTEPTKPEAEVISKDAGGRVSVHFAGLLRDAKTFIHNNFPRPHVEPGSNAAVKADVFLRTSDGTTTAYHGADSGGDDGWHPVDDQGNVVAATSGVDQEPAIDGTQLPSEQEGVQ